MPTHVPKRTISGERPKGPVVLIVEDVADVRTVFAELLVREGFGVVEGSNGNEAIIYAHAVRPDIIVMDVSLPLLDGIAATRVLRSHDSTRDTPIIALTGYPLDHAARKDFDHVLMKPCVPEVLMQRIRGELARVEANAKQR
jgi:two-component system phosphate regulon response regulator PhoB